MAQVAELVDAHGSGPCAFGCGGSSPLLGTSYYSFTVGLVPLISDAFIANADQKRLRKTIKIFFVAKQNNKHGIEYHGQNYPHAGQ